MTEERDERERSNMNIKAAEFRGKVLTTLEFLEKDTKEFKRTMKSELTSIQDSLLRQIQQTASRMTKMENKSQEIEIKVAKWASIIALIVSITVYVLGNLFFK